MAESNDAVTLIAVGDISPRRQEKESQFDAVREIFLGGDITFGQLESVLSNRGTGQLFTGYSNFGSGQPMDAAASAKILAADGFDAMSFATNHTLDRSEESMFDTIDAVRAAGVEVMGAGKNLEDARQPVILERNGTKVGFLAYCSVTPRGYEAQANRAGIVPARARTYYEQTDWQPGTPPRIVTEVYPEDLSAMVADVETLRSEVDVVVVSMHGGIHFELGTVAMYQYEYSHAAVDAGADLVLWSHGHVAKPVEVYKGKAIFHGVANFSLVPKGPKGEFYNGSVIYDSCRTQIVKCTIANKAIERVAFIPCWIDERLTPEPTPASDPRFGEFVRFMEWSADFARLGTKFETDGDEIVIDLIGSTGPIPHVPIGPPAAPVAPRSSGRP